QIREEGHIRSTFYENSVYKQLNETEGCIPVIVDLLQKPTMGFIIEIALLGVSLPFQTVLISIVCVNDTGMGRLVKKEGVASMEKMEKFKSSRISSNWISQWECRMETSKLCGRVVKNEEIKDKY
ncbi:hypothetical protein PFISCL1PPCAC_24061, partial [Pristionchus fissidentatus]